MRRLIVGLILGLAIHSAPSAPISTSTETIAMKNISHSNAFQVIELRRYQIKPGRRADFAAYFESYFPEAFQQLGAIAFGQFFERKNTDTFTWLRGFKDMDARAVVNAAFYYGAVWKEHKATLNDLMVDSDNVLLLRPLDADSGVTVLPAVDPVKELQGAGGVVVAQIFALTPGSVERFAQQAAVSFAGYREAGMRQAGVLVTLDASNNFPQLSVRTDGPYLVWLGLAKDNQQLDSKFNPLAERAAKDLAAGGLLRAEPETVVLDPTRRSRLRWLPQ
ncbi:MAG: NIPSNAP family protein [Collimonas pratensis]|uniref:NIPSNAP family protein n=1 Tax=Collimonas pratensis TaxID=279113 RepID=UPI003C794E0C